MPSIGDVGDELWHAHERIAEAASSVHKAERLAGEAVATVSEALDGSSSALGEEGLSQWRQAGDAIEEALRLCRSGQDTLAQYIVSITIRGPGGSRRSADGAYRTAEGKYAGAHGSSRSGSEAEAKIHSNLKAMGRDVDERQQYTRTPVAIKGMIKSGPRAGVLEIPAGTVRRYDGAVQRGGQWYGIEVKGGTATKTPEQRIIDNWLKRPGNTLTTPDGKTLVGVLEFTVEYE
jgi:hypothetical protein